MMLFSFPLFFLTPYILSHLLQNPFSVPKSWGLASLPVGPGEARPLNVLSAFYCALLCLVDEIKRSLFNKSTTIGICSPEKWGGQNTLSPLTSKSGGTCPPVHPVIDAHAVWLLISTTTFTTTLHRTFVTLKCYSLELHIGYSWI